MKKIDTSQAKTDKLFYVVSNAVIYRTIDNRCLILKRDKNEKVYPGLWSTPGGKLEHRDFDQVRPTRKEGEVLVYEDIVYKLLAREVLEESGAKIKLPPRFISSKAIVRGDGVPVVMINFAAEYAGGEIKPEVGAFTEFTWVNSEEINDYTCIEGVAEEIKQTIKLISSKNG